MNSFLQKLSNFLSPLLCLLLFATPPAAKAAVTVTLGKNFLGSTYGVNSQSVPPDGNGAVGPSHFMEFINGTVAVYSKVTGLSVQRKSNAAFWADAGLIISSDAVTTDPRVIYDPASQRWFATQVDFDAAAADPTSEANNFLLAVSTTASPTGVWKGFKFQADPDNGFFADFPTLGLDTNAVYLSGDFYSAGEVPEGAGLVSIPKADLTSATPTVANMTWFGVMDYAVRGEVLQPAICTDGSTRGNILSMGDIGNDSDPHSNLVWFAVQNAGGLTPTLTPSTFLNVLPYVVPDNPNLGVPQFTAHQPDGTTTLQANDARLSAKVYAVGGVLYAVGNTELNGRLAIRWYRVRAADHTLLEQGTLADPNLDLYFPSIAANHYGVVVIGCNGSGGATYISSYAYVGETKNGQTTFGGGLLLKAGVDNYHDISETFGLATDSRWGDYSATSVDPANPTHFWTLQSWADFSDPNLDYGIWATQITEVIATTPPQLAIAPAGANVLLSWPLYASNYQLQSSSTLLNTAAWAPVASSLSTNGFVISTLVSKTAAPTFFRLKAP